MPSPIILGIDPGNTGGLALIDPKRALIHIIDMPTFEFFTTKNRVKLDPYGVTRALSLVPISCAYIEDVHSSPQMGVVSAFNFGEGKGILLGCLAALGIPVTPVKPAVWKKTMRCPADKKATVMRASQLLPDVAHLFKGPRGGVYDGRAESALLGLYGALDLGLTPSATIKIWEMDDDGHSTGNSR